MSWPLTNLGDLITESRIPADYPNADRRIRVRLNVLGVEKRPLENEKEGATKQFIRRAGQFIYGKQNFHKGAFGIVPSELDGFESSADIPSFDIRDDCLPEWIYYYFKIGNRYLDLERIARGVGSKRIHPDQIANIRIPLPDLKTQRGMVEKFKGMENRSEMVTVELSDQLDLVNQLRQAFLREALQGKLVPQDPKDEPASELIKRIKAEKEKLIKEGKIKKQKELPPINPDEIPFEIPKNWVWCRLGELVLSMSTGPFGTMLHKQDYVPDGIPMVNPMNIVNSKIVASGKMMVDEQTRQRLKSYILRTGDVVVGRRGEMGRCAVVTEQEDGWLCGTGSFFLVLHQLVYQLYFVKVLSSSFARTSLMGSSVGATMNNLNHKILSQLAIPLPPFNEQRRIVDKIEEIMRYCTDLEKSIKQSQAQNEQLLQQVLREALSPDKTKKGKSYKMSEEVSMAAED